MVVFNTDPYNKTCTGVISYQALSGAFDVEVLGALNSDMISAGDLLRPNFGDDNFAPQYCRQFKVHPMVKITSDYSGFSYNGLDETKYRFGTIQYGFGFDRQIVGDGIIDTPVNYKSFDIIYPVQSFPPFTTVVNYPFEGTDSYVINWAGVDEDLTHPVNLAFPGNPVYWGSLAVDLTATSISMSLRNQVFATLLYVYWMQGTALYNGSEGGWQLIYAPPL